MRRIFEVTLSGLVIIDDGQPDGPGKSIPSNWSAHEICQEMQDMQVHDKEMQVIRKVPSLPVGRSLADKTMHWLKCSGSTGMTRTQIRNQFNRHKSSAELSQVLETLAESGRARMERVPTGGRPEERWFACMGE